MVELLVMRHAKSDWMVGARDFDRPLNTRGERAALAMAELLLADDLVPDRVVSSSAVRARTTAQTVIDVCAIDSAAVVFDDDLYGASASQWIAVAQSQVATVQRLMVCGHNPGLDDLVETLSSRLVPLSPSGKLMTTAAIAHFEFPSWSALTPGTAHLIDILRPV